MAFHTFRPVHFFIAILELMVRPPLVSFTPPKHILRHRLDLQVVVALVQDPLDLGPERGAFVVHHEDQSCPLALGDQVLRPVAHVAPFHLLAHMDFDVFPSESHTCKQS